MVPNYLSVSGVDPNEGATTVYVWRRDTASKDGLMLLGTGLVVSPAAARLGVRQGEFRVTIPLPPGCSAADVVVTDDVKEKETLGDVVVTPCAQSALFWVRSKSPPDKQVGADGTALKGAVGR